MTFIFAFQGGWLSQVVEEEEGNHLDDFSWREKDFSDLIGKMLLAIMDNCRKHF